MEKKDVERAKEIIKKYDPALVAVAVREIDIKAEDVEKAKEGIMNVYESIPTAEDRRKVLSKAVSEVNEEVIGEEINKIKAAFKVIDKAIIKQAAYETGIVMHIDPGYCIEYMRCLGGCLQVMRVLDTRPGGCLQVMRVLDRYTIYINPAPVDATATAVLEVAKANPVVYKAAQKMIDKMEEMGEL